VHAWKFEFSVMWSPLSQALEGGVVRHDRVHGRVTFARYFRGLSHEGLLPWVSNWYGVVQ
jgi:hypothetical protein